MQTAPQEQLECDPLDARQASGCPTRPTMRVVDLHGGGREPRRSCFRPGLRVRLTYRTQWRSRRRRPRRAPCRPTRSRAGRRSTSSRPRARSRSLRRHRLRYGHHARRSQPHSPHRSRPRSPRRHRRSSRSSFKRCPNPCAAQSTFASRAGSATSASPWALPDRASSPPCLKRRPRRVRRRLRPAPGPRLARSRPTPSALHWARNRRRGCLLAVRPGSRAAINLQRRPLPRARRS